MVVWHIECDGFSLTPRSGSNVFITPWTRWFELNPFLPECHGFNFLFDMEMINPWMHKIRQILHKVEDIDEVILIDELMFPKPYPNVKQK